MRQKLINITHPLTEIIHLLFGALTAIIIHNFYPQTELNQLLPLALFASIAPDADHFLYYFVYARNTKYSKKTKGYLKNLKFKKWALFCSDNHKKLTGLYTHSIATLILVLIAAIWAFKDNHITLATFLFAWASHYIWDILEDLLHFKKLNKNWWLKFQKEVEDLIER